MSIENNLAGPQNLEDTLSRTYYQLGLKYLISGVNQCLNQMQGCDQASKEGQRILSDLTNGVMEKISAFCFNHLQGDSHGPRDPSIFNRLREAHRLEQELSSAKKSNRRLKRANLRLKKRVRTLKVNLSQVKYGLARYMDSVASNTTSDAPTPTEALQDTSSVVSVQVDEQALDSQTQTPTDSEQPEEAEPPVQTATKISNLPNLPKKIKNKAIQAAAIVTQKQPEESKLQDETALTELASKVVQNLENLHQKSALKKIEEMSLKIAEVRNHKDGFIGKDWTLLAMKDHNSYMIGTKRKGVKLIEGNNQLYSGRLPVENGLLVDIIYVQHLNCYLVHHDYKIYRKDVNDQPPYLYMKIKIALRIGSSFRYSKIHERVIIAKNLRYISALNVEKKQVEIRVKKKFGDKIQEFRIFGKGQNTVISVTNDGHILAHKLNFKKKSEQILSHLELKLLKHRGEIGTSLAVCDKDQFIFVEISQEKSPYLASRIMILELGDQNLILKATMDRFRFSLGEDLALEFFGYVGGHALAIALSRKVNGMAKIFDYNTGTGEFRELEEKRLKHEEKEPTKLIRLGDQFYYSGEEGKVMKLSVKI